MFGEINISCNPISEVLRHYKGMLYFGKGGMEYQKHFFKLNTYLFQATNNDIKLIKTLFVNYY